MTSTAASSAQASGSDSDTVTGVDPPQALMDTSEVLISRWDSSRAGARAGRGFHFQDAVGALLGAMIAAGELSSTMLVPEGLDDLWLEGPEPIHVQVKSRLDRLGPFSQSDAATHVVESWQHHASRGQGETHRLIVVLERGVENESALHDLHRPLEDVLPDDSGLREAIERRARQRGLDDRQVWAVLASTTVIGMTWPKVTAETTRALRSMAEIPTSALEYAARDLRSLVADAADSNADADFDQRVSLDRTALAGAFERIVEHIDLDALDAAIVDGICEPLDLRQPIEAGERFYQGVSTQPGHVAAGLVVPRPDLVAATLAGLDSRSAAVLTGPSGVGKSAVLWTIPLALPGVLWFRVRHLADDDVSAILRLVRAYGAKPDTPVGLLVDAAGTGNFDGWARLRSEAAAIPGILLVATARREDLMVLGDLSGCATIEVALDDAAAEVIFDGLTRRGATAAPHWREAFAQSDGLTMEFTHLLTRGRRLAEVIDDQVRVRLQDDRAAEFEVLRLVSVADRWSTSLPAARVAEACDLTEFELRKAISRLAGEHLVTEKDGMLTGLHRLRSQAICRSVHRTPPPAQADSVRIVAELVPTQQLHRFVANCLADNPEFETSIIEAAITQSREPDRLVGYLHGLRLADFHDKARIWKDIADRHRVPRSSQPALLQFATAGLDFPDFFPEPIREARREMTFAMGPDRHRALTDRVGPAHIAGMLEAIDDIALATRLLSVLRAREPDLTAAIDDHISDNSSLVHALRDATVEQLGNCLAVARECEPRLAELLSSAIGGEEEILRRLRADNPWLIELDVRFSDGNPVGFARILHASDDLQGDPHDRTVAVARTLLRCIPRIESVDVQALLPGGHEIVLGGHTHGESRLQRRYDHSTLNIALNQSRIRAAHALLADTDTNRLATALPLLTDAVRLLREAGTVLVTGRGIDLRPEELASAVSQLRATASSIRPSRGSVELGDTAIGEHAGIPIADDATALLIDVADLYGRLGNRDGYGALAAYISDTVITKHLQGARAEPWDLIGIDGEPADLQELVRILSDLHAIVDEMSNADADVSRVARAAMSGKATGALSRAAESCRRSSRRRTQRHKEAIVRRCEEIGLQCRLRTIHEKDHRTRFALTIELDSLLEWYEVADQLRQALEEQWDEWGTIVLVPFRKGRPVPALAMKLITSLWPTDDLGPWEAELPQPHRSDLLVHLDQAHKALQFISAVLELPQDQQNHRKVTESVESAVADFHSATERILELPRDRVIDELLDMLNEHSQQVTQEAHPDHREPGLAARVAAGGLGTATSDEVNTLVAARVFALEWDIDPNGAVEMLDQ